jgi:hypothetical protein
MRRSLGLLLTKNIFFHKKIKNEKKTIASKKKEDFQKFPKLGLFFNHF